MNKYFSSVYIIDLCLLRLLTLNGVLHCTYSWTYAT